ncbi:MAG: acetyltransferase, partial [Deltaproteobacteria bacterium]|nr:acetyltransferase [Deltaproteobacteria bacterium]
MLRFLPAWCIGLISLSLYLVNCFVIGTIILVLALFKVIPNKTWQGYCSQVLVLIGVFWVDINSFNIRLTKKIKWDIQGLDGLSPGGWYLVISNHRTWADILVLQEVFNHRIPFLKFFVKQQLIWLPLVGQVWWAMDFPFMKRYSREFLKKHPELEGKDIETTRRACEKFKFHPISIMNFVEGTRFTPEKHQKQNSA